MFDFPLLVILAVYLGALLAWGIGYAQGRTDGIRAADSFRSFRPMCDLPLEDDLERAIGARTYQGRTRERR